MLNPPTPPSPATTAVSIALQPAASGVSGLSIAHGGDFLGFSIEFSVITNVSAYPPFFRVYRAVLMRVRSWTQLVSGAIASKNRTN